MKLFLHSSYHWKSMEVPLYPIYLIFPMRDMMSFYFFHFGCLNQSNLHLSSRFWSFCVVQKTQRNPHQWISVEGKIDRKPWLLHVFYHEIWGFYMERMGFSCEIPRETSPYQPRNARAMPSPKGCPWTWPSVGNGRRRSLEKNGEGVPDWPTLPGLIKLKVEDIQKMRKNIEKTKVAWFLMSTLTLAKQEHFWSGLWLFRLSGCYLECFVDDGMLFGDMWHVWVYWLGQFYL